MGAPKTGRTPKKEEEEEEEEEGNSMLLVAKTAVLIFIWIMKDFGSKSEFMMHFLGQICRRRIDKDSVMLFTWVLYVLWGIYHSYRRCQSVQCELFCWGLLELTAQLLDRHCLWLNTSCRQTMLWCHNAQLYSLFENNHYNQSLWWSSCSCSAALSHVSPPKWCRYN